MFSQQGDVVLFKKEPFCCATDLLHIEQEWLTSKKADSPKVKPKVHALQNFLSAVDSMNASSLLQRFSSEKDAFLAVVSDVLSKFCTEVKLSNREYNAQDMKNHNCAKNVTIAPLGMGAPDTWRGAPDARLRGFHVPDDGTSVNNEVPVMYGRSGVHDAEESNGTSTGCEAKLQIKKSTKPQFVKMCVVAAFIERNLHSELNPMIPSIIIDTCRAQVALYCTESDVLMISEKFYWRRGPDFDIGGISLLWTMINHR